MIHLKKITENVLINIKNIVLMNVSIMMIVGISVLLQKPKIVEITQVGGLNESGRHFANNKAVQRTKVQRR